MVGKKLDELLNISNEEKIRRFDEMCKITFSHIDGRDLLQELCPAKILDIKKRIDGVETWYEADWLKELLKARNAKKEDTYE